MYLWLPNLLNMMTVVVDPSVSGVPETVCEFVSYNVNATSYSSTESSTECNDEIRDGVYMSTLVVGVLYIVTYSSYGFLVSIFGKRTVLGKQV